MKKILICLLSILLLLSLTACSNGSAESVNSEGELTRKLKSKSDKVIEVSGDIVLTKTIEIVGNKEIVGNGSITVSVADMQDGYVIGLSEGAHLTVGGSVRLDLAGLAGGIHVKEGTELTLQDEALVTGASVKASNVLVEGAFTMNGGFLKMAKGHNLINKGDATIAGGELKGCGGKCAVIYNDGTLTQNDGTIVGGYHNIVGVSGSSFVWNKGEIKTSLQDAIVIEEEASIDITSTDAKLTEVYAKGLVVNGEGVIDGVTMKNSMDSMIAVGKNGELTLNGGKITEAGVHGIDNAGTLLMTDGVVYANDHSGICNTGSLEITGGDLMNNKSKGVLNKAGIAKILDEKVTITGNEEGVANEIGAYIELSAASIIQNKDSNIYAYGGDMYIHDIALSSSGAGCINVTAADVILENVDIQGTTGGKGAHGIYMTGGTVTAKNTNWISVNGSALRVVGKTAVFEGSTLSFSDIQYNGISITAGTVDIDGLTTNELGSYNVLVEGGTVNLSNASLGKTPENSIRTKKDAVLNLENVDILGHTKDVKGDVFGLIIDNGNVTANNLTVKDTFVAGIRIKGGTFSADKVKISNAGKHGINAKSGVSKIENLTTSNIKGCNVYMTGDTKLTLTNAKLGKCTDNSIKEYGNKEAVLNLTNVKVLGHAENALESVHGLIIDNGSVTAKNFEISDVVSAGIRVRGGSLKAENVTTSNAGSHGVHMTAGTADITRLIVSGTGEHGIYTKSGVMDITNLKTQGVSKCNIYMVDDAKLTVTDAELGKCVDNSIKEYGNRDAVLNLTNVRVLGHVKNALTGVHGLIIDNGSVTAKNLEISDVVAAGIRVRGGGLTAENVTTSNVGSHGVHMTSGTANITGLTISTTKNNGVYMTAGTANLTNLTTSDVSECNIYMVDDAKLTVTDAELGKCVDNSIKEYGNKNAVLNLTNVKVLGHAENALPNVHGLIIDNGSVTAKNLEISDVVAAGLRVRGGGLTAENVTTSNVGSHGVHMTSGTANITGLTISTTKNNGVYMTAGTANLTNLTTSDVSECNIYMEEDAKLTVTDAELGKCVDNSIKEYGNEEAVLNLTNVKILGHVEEALESVHGLIVDNGSVTAKNLEISGVVAAGLRVRGGSLTAEDVTTLNVGSHGVHMTAGTANVTGLAVSNTGEHGVYFKSGVAEIKNLEINNVTENGVSVIGGTVTLDGAQITGNTYDVYNTTSDLKLAGIINADVYNDAAVTINADSLENSEMTIDWPLNMMPTNMVGIQFSSEEHATKSANYVSLGVNVGSLYEADIVSDKMMIVDKGIPSFKVKNYDELVTLLEQDNLTVAEINISGDIVVPSTITIAEGKDIILNDDGNLRTIVRDTTFDPTQEGVLFKVLDNASLTFKSTGTDENPLLVVNGSKDSYSDISENWALIETSGTNSKVSVNAGVKFTNNYSAQTGSAINMKAGSLTVNGGIFSDNTSNNSGGAIYINEDVIAMIENASFIKNFAGQHGGAIFNVDDSKMEIKGCKFDSNETTGNGGAVANNNKKSLEDASIKKCVFANNKAAKGGAVSLASKSFLALEDCEFTDNTATARYTGTEEPWGNDIRIGGTVTEVHISGKMDVEIFNESRTVLYVDGTLTDGSDVQVEWCTDDDNKIPTNGNGIVFASDDVMNASQAYISLGNMISAKYSIAYADKLGKLVVPTYVDSFETLSDALTTISKTEDKLGVIRLSKDISVTDQITIPSGSNITIENDRTARTLSRNVQDKDMINVEDKATLTLRSTGTVDDCKLILDGQNLGVTNNQPSTIIRLTKDVTANVHIYDGVKLQNNNSGKGGAGVCVETTSGAVYVNGAFFENISATGDGGVFYLKSPCTIMNSKFKNNTSAKSGGAIIVKTESTTSIINTHFENCNAKMGGAIRSQGILQLVGTLSNATFLNNTATEDGSALYIDGTLTGSGYTFTPAFSESVFVKSGAINNYSN